MKTLIEYEQNVLAIMDSTYDGILTFSILKRKGNNFKGLTHGLTHEAIRSLLNKGVIKMRDCIDVAYERVDNTKSKYGMQAFYNERIHLTKAEYLKVCEEFANEPLNGFVMYVYDDTGCCINSRRVRTPMDAWKYFRQVYNDDYNMEILEWRNDKLVSVY